MTDETDTSAAGDTEAGADSTSEEGTIVTATPDSTDTGDGDQSGPAGDAEGESKDTKPEGGDGKIEEGAPKDYADFTLPEGFEKLDEDLLAKFLPMAKEAGMSQERAQSFVDIFANQATGQIESQVAAFTEVNNANLKACKEHAEFGGNNFDGSVIKCARAIDVLMGDEAKPFREMLDQTGLGNNPYIFSLLTKVGGSISEDGIVAGGKASAPKDAAKEFYGSDGKGRKTET